MKVLPALTAIAFLSAGAAYADCSYPPPPDKLPDGSTATMQEMVDAQKTIKDYDKAINAYIACIQLERSDALAKGGDKVSKEQQADLERVEVQKHNAAVDQLQGIANRFNEQVKIYKAKHSSKPQG